MALAFSMGCRAHSIPCDVRHVREFRHSAADIVWLYGMGEAKVVFDGHPKALRLVGDKGYFAGFDVPRHIRVSVNAQQPDAHLRLRKHPSDRFKALGIKVEPVSHRGDYVLLCGIGPKQCGIQGLHYGQWERETFAKLKTLTNRPIIVREKPKNPPIHGVPRSGHSSTSDAIRGAWAVVCLTGNIGIDSILHGVPVIAKEGPGSVYYDASLSDIETIQPLPLEKREQALADIAYWQWRRDEFSNGAFLNSLKLEGMI
jgi:hypothetical protein